MDILSNWKLCDGHTIQRDIQWYRHIFKSDFQRATNVNRPDSGYTDKSLANRNLNLLNTVYKKKYERGNNNASTANTRNYYFKIITNTYMFRIDC